MEIDALERKLKRKLKRNYLITGIILLLSIALIVLFEFLFEKSKVIEYVGPEIYPIETVKYNYSFAIGIFIGVLLGLFSFIALIVELLFCSVSTIYKKDLPITLYRGFACRELYVDGELVKRAYYGYFDEVKLKDGSSIHISYSRGAIMAHATFSDGTESTDF